MDWIVDVLMPLSAIFQLYHGDDICMQWVYIYFNGKNVTIFIPHERRNNKELFIINYPKEQIHIHKLINIFL